MIGRLHHTLSEEGQNTAAVGEAAPIMAARKQCPAVSGAHIKRLTLGPALQTVTHKAVFLLADMRWAHEVAKQPRYGHCSVMRQMQTGKGTWGVL